ncbi:MAG TPA: hypothetical protein VGJ39_04270 [Vicinamibacterales bacterium]|jgi:hypothetical protein
MKAEVYLALVEFGRQREQAALDLLVPTLHRVCPGAALRTVVVDNALDGEKGVGLPTPFSDVDRVSGDNTMHEFSGWDRGIAWLQQRYAPAPESILVLANDTIVRADKHDRVRDMPADRAAAASCGALVGWIDEYPRTVELFGLVLRQWIDTSLVLAEWRTLAALRPLARPPADDVFADDWRAIFREPSPLTDNYRAYLRTYFFGDRGDGEFDHGWYAQEPLSAHNFEAFKLKLRCVFCEHLLSARARARGIPLVDIRPTPLAVDPFDVVAS